MSYLAAGMKERDIRTKDEQNSMAFAGMRRFFLAPALLYVSFDDGFELICNVGAPQGRDFLTIDIDGRRWKLTGSRQRDSDIGMFRFAGTVDDAAHDGELQCLEARIVVAPVGHAITHIGL